MASANKKLNGRVAIITGASTGIGARAAVLFAQEGALVSLVGLEKPEQDKVAEECRALGTKAISSIGDITSEEFRVKVVEDTIKAFGKIDVLVNNAGIFKPAGILEPNDTNFDNVMDVNLRSVYRMTALCVPHLKKTKGNIISTSSVSAKHPNCDEGLAYHIAKAGVDMFTKSAAVELAPFQIRINCVSPGFIYTRVNKHVNTEGEEGYRKFYEAVAKDHALQRVGTPDEIGKVMLFLASDDASFMTGSDVLVDGGYLVHKHGFTN